MGAQGNESSLSATMKLQLRRAAATEDFHSAPQYVLRVARAEGLHRRFLGRKSRGKVDRRHAPAVAIGHFAVREYPPQKPIAVFVDGIRDPADIGGVQAHANDLGHL